MPQAPDTQTTYRIYALVDLRRPNHYRYIGCTQKPLLTRLEGHVRRARRRDDGAKTGWIRRCMAQGWEPNIILLCTVITRDLAQALETEDDFIRCYWARGHQLLNEVGSGLGGNRGLGPLGHHPLE